MRKERDALARRNSPWIQRMEPAEREGELEAKGVTNDRWAHHSEEVFVQAGAFAAGGRASLLPGRSMESAPRAPSSARMRLATAQFCLELGKRSGLAVHRVGGAGGDRASGDRAGSRADRPRAARVRHRVGFRARYVRILLYMAVCARVTGSYAPTPEMTTPVGNQGAQSG